MSKMMIEVDEDALIEGKYDGLGKMSVDIEYVKDLISTCRRLTLRNTALTHDLAEVVTERNKLLQALGAEVRNDNGNSFLVVDIFSNWAINDSLEPYKSRKCTV